MIFLYFDDVDLDIQIWIRAYSAELIGVSDIPDWFNLDTSTGIYSIKVQILLLG